MKNLIALIILSSFIYAGDYHKDSTLVCSQCHVMHYSQSHGYGANGTGFYTAPGAGGPFEHLLRDSVNNLCLSCHDGAGIAPDVLGTLNGGNNPSDVRLAGYLNRAGIGNDQFNGHTLDSLDDAPGSEPSWNSDEGLKCTDCHHQHGYAGGDSSYRNLRIDPGHGTNLLVSYNDGQPGINDLSKDVFQRQEHGYDESDVDWNEPDNTNSAIGEWCGGCHNNFHNTTNFLLHPDAGVNIGELGGGHSNLGVYNSHNNKVKVMSEVGVWNPAGSDVTVTCISCHKAHGNGNAFGLIFRSGTGLLTEDGDTDGHSVEHLCRQCHVQ